MRIKIFLLLMAFTLASSSFGLGKSRDWIASGGVGMAFASPTLFLLSPALEYAYTPDVLVGGLAQMGLGSEFLFTAAGTVRYVFDIPDSRIHPTIQGGLGLATASSSASSAVGVDILMGFGIDYAYDRTMSFGSMLRLNFAPPLKSSFACWDMVTVRLLL